MEKRTYIFNIACAAALLVCYLTPYISPELFWPIAFFGLIYLPLLLVNLLFFLFWLIKANKKMLLSMLCLFWGVIGLSNEFGLRQTKPNNLSSNQQQLRIMAYNVHNFISLDHSNNNQFKHNILQIVHNDNPDVVGFEEYLVQIKGYRIVDSIKKTLNLPFYYFKAFSSTPTDSTGLAIYSKYRIINAGFIKGDKKEKIQSPGIFADILFHNKICRVYCLHLQSTYLDDGRATKSNLFKSTLTIVKKLKLAFIKRSRQVYLVRNSTAKCINPFVICGDFNDVPNSYAVNEIGKGLKNTFYEKGYGLGITFAGKYPAYQIDYIIVSNHFNVLSYQITKKKLSDHYPVYADVAL